MALLKVPSDTLSIIIIVEIILKIMIIYTHIYM